VEASTEQAIRRIKIWKTTAYRKVHADFVCFQRRIIIEVDGGHHALHTQKDLKKDNWFSEQGFKVLRFWNNEIFANINQVYLKKLGRRV
jgi:very-short-patch-repair endonuclease